MDLDFAVESSGTKCILVRAGNSWLCSLPHATTSGLFLPYRIASLYLLETDERGERAKERERERKRGGI